MFASRNLYIIYEPLDKSPTPPTTHLLGARKVCNVVAVLHDDNFDDVVAVVVAQEAAALRLRCPLNGGCIFVHFESCSGGSRAITGPRLSPGGGLNTTKICGIF